MLSALLLGLLALSVAVGLQAVGIILVVAMLITPGATALWIESDGIHTGCQMAT